MNQENEAMSDGERIRPLADLGQDVSPEFLGIVRKKISRRTAANHMVSFSWNLPKVILLEMVMLISQFVSGPERGKLGEGILDAGTLEND